MPPSNKRKRTVIMEPVPFEEKLLSRYTFPVIVQPKLNGERCLAQVTQGESVILLSSTGLNISSVPHIQKELLQYPSGYYDGELYNSTLAVQDIHSIVSRKVGLHPDHHIICFHIFDIARDLDQRRRYDSLWHTYNEAIGQPHLMLVEPLFCITKELVWMALEQYSASGYEGIVIRNSVALYTPGKQPLCMMKYKPKKQDVYKIVGFQEEVDKYGMPKGSLGSFILSDARNNIFKSGSGLTKDQREHYWYHREEYRGMYVLIEYPELTKRGVPSQPIFKEIRKDKDE